MKANAFRRSLWLFDGLVGIIFGFWIGRTLQLEADSGDYLPNKILAASLIGVFSYLLALLVALTVKKRFQIISYIWISILGGMLFAFNKYIIWYLIENWSYSKSHSVLEYVIQLLPRQIVSFSFIWAFTSFLSFFIFLLIRLFIYCFERLRLKLA